MTNGWQDGPGMSGTELERMARQAWDAWREALQQTAPHAGSGAAPFSMPGAGAGHGMFGMPGGMPGAAGGSAHPWRDAVDWWSRYAPAGNADVGNLVERFNGQARDWFGQMQQLASRFAGQGGTPKEIADAWRQVMGGAEANPFAQMFGSLQSPGVEGFDAWMARVAPFLDGMRGEQRDWLNLPTFGVAREHQTRLQALAQAQADYQQSQQGYHELMARASQAAFGIFERKLGEHAVPGQQIESPRALFDLWIDAAEEAYAEIALSSEFRTAYANQVNGQMRLRLAVQKEIEQVCRMVDMPTRTELDGAHRKIADLERSLRRLRDRVDVLSPRTRSARASDRPVRQTAPRAAAPNSSVDDSAAGVRVATPVRAAGSGATAASKRTPASKRASRNATPAPSAPKKTAAKKVATKQAARNAAARATTGAAIVDTASASPPAAATRKRRSPATGNARVASRKSAMKQTGTKKVVSKKAATKQAATRQAAAKHAAPSNAAATKGATKKIASKKAARKKAVPKKLPATKTAPKTKSARQAAGTQTAAPTRKSATSTRTRTRGRAATAASPTTPRTSRRTPSLPRGRSRTATGAASATAKPGRATRQVARTPARVAPVPNYGFISPIPSAPEPMNDARAKRAATRKR